MNMLPKLKNEIINNVVIVSKSDGEFSDPVAAVKSIKDAAPDNPYYIVLSPGEFVIAETLVIKPFVNIVGSGRAMTKLTGAISSEFPEASSAIISGTHYSILQDLTIENLGGSFYSIALHSNEGKFFITNVIAKARGGSWSSVGILNDVHSKAILANVIAIGYGPESEECYGVVNTWFSTPTLIKVTAVAAGGRYRNKDILSA